MRNELKVSKLNLYLVTNKMGDYFALAKDEADAGRKTEKAVFERSDNIWDKEKSRTLNVKLLAESPARDVNGKIIASEFGILVV